MMDEYRERQGLVHSSGDDLIERFVKAGFVDIKVFRKKFYIGDWGEDPEGAEYWRGFKDSLQQTIIPFMDVLTDWIPDREERERFGKDTDEEFRNSNYHLYSIKSQMIFTVSDL